ncbi:lipase secretion chaperone [Marinobacter mobilis]|uniref:Lipase chaperone n=1 Tax=Marinobacter mobilis TaxID=488533 RepID=A0A1H2SUE7_9GAMM|nr:lipase secretion chaperone [Marinobacter mobilis]SDW35198.1 Lipase chaperone LimK [Marinobacter mobilis]
MKHTVPIAVASSLVLACVATLSLMSPSSGPGQPPADGPVSAPLVNTALMPPARGDHSRIEPAQAASPLPPLPSHLADAMPEIRFEVNDEGDLIPTHATRTLFDFFLSGLEDEPLPQVLARLEQTLSSHLDEPALSQARALLDRYLNYRIQLDALAREAQPVRSPSGFDLVVLQQRQETLEGLRQGNFSSAEAQAFFGLEEAQDRYMLGYLRISQDTSLTDRERASALASLDHQLPQPIREVRQRVTRHGELYQQVRQMRADGATDADVYQARAQTLGNDAAARLAELDQQRINWQQRLNTFIQERNRILQSGLSASDQQAAIDEVLTRRFSGPEITRVRALSTEL